jgi:hypothetical protein
MHLASCDFLAKNYKAMRILQGDMKLKRNTTCEKRWKNANTH